jgi:hypothetical protein
VQEALGATVGAVAAEVRDMAVGATVEAVARVVVRAFLGERIVEVAANFGEGKNNSMAAAESLASSSMA